MPVKCDRETLVVNGKMRRFAAVLLVILLLVLWASTMVASASMVWSG
jgi:hypothetical protein